MFPDENSARIYFEKQMWNDKPVCPYCGGTHITTLKKKGVYRCKANACKKKVMKMRRYRNREYQLQCKGLYFLGVVPMKQAQFLL